MFTSPADINTSSSSSQPLDLDWESSSSDWSSSMEDRLSKKQCREKVFLVGDSSSSDWSSSMDSRKQGRERTILVGSGGRDWESSSSDWSSSMEDRKQGRDLVGSGDGREREQRAPVGRGRGREEEVARERRAREDEVGKVRRQHQREGGFSEEMERSLPRREGVWLSGGSDKGKALKKGVRWADQLESCLPVPGLREKREEEEEETLQKRRSSSLPMVCGG